MYSILLLQNKNIRKAYLKSLANLCRISAVLRVTISGSCYAEVHKDLCFAWAKGSQSPAKKKVKYFIFFNTLIKTKIKSVEVELSKCY